MWKDIEDRTPTIRSPSFVRVTKAAGTAFYAVVTSTEDSALRAVRQAIRPGDRAAIMEHRLSPDRVKALRLRFGVAIDVTRACA